MDDLVDEEHQLRTRLEAGEISRDEEKELKAAEEGAEKELTKAEEKADEELEKVETEAKNHGVKNRFLPTTEYDERVARRLFKKFEPKVLILTHANAAGIPVEFIHADRQLAEMLGRNLLDYAKTSEEKLSILPQRRVEEFKNANPDWKQMPTTSIGRKLGADYVVYLELNSLSLYEPGSNHALFRGRANLTLNPDMFKALGSAG